MADTPAPAPAPKNIFRSKTVWLNLLIAVGYAFPVLGDWMKAHPDFVLYGVAALNIALRKVSHGKVEFYQAAPGSD